MTAQTEAAPAQKISSNIFVVLDMVPALNEPPAKNKPNFGTKLNAVNDKSTAPIIFMNLRELKVGVAVDSGNSNSLVFVRYCPNTEFPT